MPIATTPIPELSEKDKARFWAKVNKDGPTQPHMDTPCWIWKEGLDADGYGYFCAQRKQFRAHRISYAITRGGFMDESICLHRCDTAACVNPQHLLTGTQAENIADMVKKGRQAAGDRQGLRARPERAARGDANGSRLHPERLARGARNGKHTKPECTPRGDSHYAKTKPELLARGERHHKAKITESNVREIRALHATGAFTLTALGARFGVDYSSIGYIIHRKTWKHVA